MKITNCLISILFAATMVLPSVTIAQNSNEPDFKVELNINGCQFAGGTDDYGNVEIKQKTGGKKIQIELLYTDEYTFEPVQFTGVGTDQMKQTAGGNANVINIFDDNTGLADVKYSINLKHKKTKDIVQCDPTIKHIP